VGRVEIGLHLLLKLDAGSLVFLQERLVATFCTQLVAEPDGVTVVLDIFDPPMGAMGIGSEMWVAH